MVIYGGVVTTRKTILHDKGVDSELLDDSSGECGHPICFQCEC